MVTGGQWGTQALRGKWDIKELLEWKVFRDQKENLWASDPDHLPCSSYFIATFNILFIVRGHWGRRVTRAHLGRVDPGDALDSLDLLDHLELGLQDLKDLKALQEFQDNKEILEIQVRN